MSAETEVAGRPALHDTAEPHETTRAKIATAGRAAVAPTDVPPPTRDPSALPFNKLSPIVLEWLVTEIVASQGSPGVHFYGRSGQKQYGLDIYEQRSNGDRVVYQVRRYQSISPEDITAAISDYAGPSDKRTARRFDANEFILVTSASVDSDTANVDCIDQLNRIYNGPYLDEEDCVQVTVWGAEALTRKLRGHSLLIYAAFGEAWTKEICGPKELEIAQRHTAEALLVEQVVRAAMAAQYLLDDEIRFRQVDLEGVTVESLFVDVPVHTFADHQISRLIKEINPRPEHTPTTDDHDSETGEASHTPGGSSLPTVGAAQLLLHPRWHRSAVLVGGPGQGKSTLLQYLCQFYRSRSLGLDAYSPISAGLSAVTDGPRCAVRADLTHYARWRKQILNQPTTTSEPLPAGATSIETFLAHVIAEAAARPFTPQNFAHLVTSTPILIALDSLDEVADPDERQHVVRELRLTTSRTLANGLDAQIVVATRPGNTPQPIWRDAQFVPLLMSGLTPGLRLQYLERWSKQSKLNKREIQELQTTFTNSMSLPHVTELARNPMQLAILLHLMKRRAVLPSKRTILYDKYIEIFMDRESKDATIAANRDHVIAFHRLLGWVIHTEVEAGRSSGSVTLPELHGLLTSYMNARGHDGNLVNQLFSSVTTRVLCLVQQNFDSAHEFRFEVQSLREYFASEHIYAMSPNNTPKNSHATALAKLALRPFWANVMRFLAGKFSFGEIAGIIYALRDLQRDAKVGRHPIIQAAAATLLEDQIFSDQEQSVTVDMIHIMLDGPGTTLGVDGLLNQTGPPILTDTRQQALILKVLLQQLESTTSPEAMGMLTRYGHTVTTSRVLIDRWWEMYTATDAWLRCAIELGVLSAHTSLPQHELIDRVVNESPASAYLHRLIANSAQVVTNQLLESTSAELRAGFDDNLSSEVDDSPYRRLVEAASVEHFFRHRYHTQDTARPAKHPLIKSSRTRRRSQARNSLTTMIDQFNLAHQSRVSTPDEWHRLFDSYSTIWGIDCWPTREAAFVLPADAVSTDWQPSIEVDASWRAISAWLHQASAHPDDTQ